MKFVNSELFKRHFKILKKAAKVQKTFADTFFVFSGGTALSCFYLKHRFSEDLDFIIVEDSDKKLLQVVHSFFSALREIGNVNVLVSDLNFFYFECQVKVENTFIKVEVSRKFFRNFLKPNIFDDIKVESLKGILLGKFEAFLSRSDPKDLIDILTAYLSEPEIFFSALNDVKKYIDSFAYADFLKKLKSRPTDFSNLKIFKPFDRIDYQKVKENLLKDFFSLKNFDNLKKTHKQPEKQPV